MKIGLCHNLYGKYSHGGAETVVELMASDLMKLGHEVFLITTKPNKIKEVKSINSPKFSEDKNSNLKIYYLNSKFYNIADLNISERVLWHINNLFSSSKYFAIKNILKEEKAELVITHNLTGLGFLTPHAIKSLNIRHEHFLHDIQLLHPSGLMIYGHENILDSIAAKIYQSITRILFSSPAKIISPSKWLLDIHLEHGFFKKSETEVRPFVWKTPENKNILNGDLASSRIKKDFLNFLFVGQIEESKGILLLIKAFKKISKAELNLTIASRNGGQLLNEILELAIGDKRINILSPLNFEETKKLMENSDCLIVPSLCYENSPTVIYGAHAAGLRVIASRIGGIPEIINDNDLLFEPGNEEDLIEKISFLNK